MQRIKFSLGQSCRVGVSCSNNSKYMISQAHGLSWFQSNIFTVFKRNMLSLGFKRERGKDRKKYKKE